MPGEEMEQREPPRKPGTSSGAWTSWIWFVLLTLAMVWVWQEGSRRVGVRTIPYSAFKNYVRNHEVVSCNIQQTEITGLIRPHKAGKQPESSPSANSAGPANAPATQPQTQTPPNTKPAPAKPSTPAPPANAQPNSPNSE